MYFYLPPTTLTTTLFAIAFGSIEDGNAIDDIIVGRLTLDEIAANVDDVIDVVLVVVVVDDDDDDVGVVIVEEDVDDELVVCVEFDGAANCAKDVANL